MVRDIRSAVIGIVVAFVSANGTSSQAIFGVEEEGTPPAGNGSLDPNPQMLGVRWHHMVRGAGYVEFDVFASRIADIDSAVAQGPAEKAVARVLDELSNLSIGASQTKGSTFTTLLDRDFAPGIVVGCPQDLRERAKNPVCVQADIPVRDIQWRQRIDDVTVMNGGRISLDRSGRVTRVAGVLVDGSAVPAFRISGDVADRISVEFLRSMHKQSGLKATTSRRGKDLGKFLAIGDEHQLVSYWEVEVAVTEPAELSRRVRVRVDAITGEAELVDYLQF